MTLAKTLKTVIVAGGGYAGALAANRLAGKLSGQARVVLVTMGDQLLDRVRLHEAAARGRHVQHSLRHLLSPTVERIDGRVIALDGADRTVVVEREDGHTTLAYDALILALGSRMTSTLPGSSPHALALADMPSAHALAARLRTLSAGERVIVVGGGLTAVELASEIAEAHPRLQVEMVASEFVPALVGAPRNALLRALARLQVQVLTDRRVTLLSPHAVHFADGSQRACAVNVLASGMQTAVLPDALKLPQDEHGRVPVDEQLRVPGYDNVFAAGDLAAPPARCIGNGQQSTRMACATALPLGAHAADQVARMLVGDALEPYRYDYSVQCISVGRRQGVLVAVDADDNPTGRFLAGRWGAVVKEAICRLVIGAIRLERLFAGLYAWPGRKRSAPARLPETSGERLPG